MLTGPRPAATEDSVTAPATTRLQVKSHNAPDEVRSPDKTRLEVVNLEGATIGRMTLQSGWRWSDCIKPVAGTDLCQVPHLGYAVSGQLTAQLADGTRQTIRAGDSYTIPPGHDGWVDGSEPFVCIEVLSAAQFAKA